MLYIFMIRHFIKSVRICCKLRITETLFDDTKQTDYG